MTDPLEPVHCEVLFFTTEIAVHAADFALDAIAQSLVSLLSHENLIEAFHAQAAGLNNALGLVAVVNGYAPHSGVQLIEAVPVVTANGRHCPHGRLNFLDRLLALRLHGHGRSYKIGDMLSGDGLLGLGHGLGGQVQLTRLPAGGNPRQKSSASQNASEKPA